MNCTPTLDPSSSDALSRVVLRTTFNTSNLLSPLRYFLTDSDIVWPINFNTAEIEDLDLPEEITLGFAFLALDRLKQEKNTALKVRKYVDPRALANVDIDDRNDDPLP